MPMYTFRCKRCGKVQDKRCAYADISKQTCEETRLVDMYLDGAYGPPTSVKQPCDGELERDGLEGHARMGHQWSQI